MSDTRLPPVDTFRTGRLIAERLRPEHFAGHQRLYRDTRVMATLSRDGEPLPEDEITRRLRAGVEHWNRYGYGFWVLRDVQGRFVGRAGLRHVEMDGRNEVELGYALLPEFWGKGLATEIAAAVLKLAFEQIGLEQVVGYTLTTNRASQRVMEKTGFRFEKEIMHAGLPHVFYRLAASEFSVRTT